MMMMMMMIGVKSWPVRIPFHHLLVTTTGGQVL